jgi:hypothetical protein
MLELDRRNGRSRRDRGTWAAWTIRRELAGTMPGGPARTWRGRVVGAVVVVLLAGWLLFCHGCHGGEHDEDDELFLRPWQRMVGK